jgi:hypothetical protein
VQRRYVPSHCRTDRLKPSMKTRVRVCSVVGREVPQTIKALRLDVELSRRKILLENGLPASLAGMVLP